MTRNFIFELGVEEIPARFMNNCIEVLSNNAMARLNEERIAYGELRTFGTPRRLVLAIKDLAEEQLDREVVSKGPSAKIAKDADGNWSRAAMGFAKGQSVDVETLEERDGYLYAVKTIRGGLTVELLPAIILDLINAFQFPKTMRWGVEGARFVRPVHWIVALYGEQRVAVEFAGIASDDFTYGHRFLSQGKLPVRNMEHYFEQLWNNSVIVDQNYRKALILEQINAAACSVGATLDIDDELLNEVNYLVEFPTALIGEFEDKYLNLPEQAVVTPMKEHQRYFPLRDSAGKLINKFVAVRNGDGAHLDNVRKGNERVLRARLADAEFFFKEDRKKPLADYVPQLASIVYQKGLGSMLDKTERIRALSSYIAKHFNLPAAQRAEVDRAAYLSKADLLTGMVGEFDELQGLMGSVYAHESGETSAVCTAIHEHYAPRFAGDALPLSIEGTIVSIADKMDNIAACFSKGLIPSGSQDPYSLRRQALGVVLMLAESRAVVTLDALVDEALALFGEQPPDSAKDIAEFFTLRVKNMLADRGIRYDVVDAVIQGVELSPYKLLSIACMVQANLVQPDFVKMCEAFGRVANISKSATGKTLRVSLYKDASDKDLFKAYRDAKKICDVAAKEGNWSVYLQALMAMTDSINSFFETTMVMVEDNSVRENRLALLLAIKDLANNMFDPGKIIA